jgi:hypothetical protein
LPVELAGGGQIDAQGVPPLAHERFALSLTPEGMLSPLLQLDPDPLENQRRWEQMPTLSGYNPLSDAKPGATVLAVHPLHSPNTPRIILASQRVGKGRSAVLATASTWKWRMGLPHADQSPERFWRQLLRWLSLQAPTAVSVALDRDNYAPGETVKMAIEARDSSFAALSDATVSVTLKNPTGGTQLVEVPRTLDRPGVYEAEVMANENGLYHLEVFAQDKTGKSLGRAASAFFVEPSRAELANADLQTALLERMAQIGGGRFFHISEAQQIAQSIAVSKSAYSRVSEQEIWDAPIVFLAIVLLLAAEWFIRRSRGLS